MHLWPRARSPTSTSRLTFGSWRSGFATQRRPCAPGWCKTQSSPANLPRAVLSLIVENVRTLLQADQAAIVLQDTVTGRLEVHDLPKFDRWTRHFTKRLLTREIAESRQPVILPDLNTVPGLDPRFAAAGYRSLIGMPILRGNRAEGALYVYSRRENHFDDWARAVTAGFARFAGLAVANLYMVRQIESYGVYTEELLALDGKMVHAADEAEQLELAWRFVHDTLGIDTFFVAFYDQATDTLWFPAAYDEGAPVSIPPRKLAGDREQWGITGHAVRTGEELNWQSESDKAAQCAALGIKPVEFGPKCRSCFCMPICSDEGIIGTLSIQAYRDHAFSPAQIEACRALGRQLVPAIINARLLARQRKTTEQLAALGNLARHIERGAEPGKPAAHGDSRGPALARR